MNRTRTNASTLGLIGAAAGLAGVALAVALMVWPPHSAPELYRYPFTVTEFLVFQALFALQHLGLTVLLVAFARSGALGGALYRGFAWLAVAGMVLFVIAELAGMAFADAQAAPTHSGLMGALYGIASTASGLGLLVAGIGVVRARRWSGWRRWSALLAGVCLFVVVMPTLMAPFLIGRLGIAAWMLTFAVLGWALHLESSDRRAESALAHATA